MGNQLFEKMRKLGIPDIVITPEEWEQEYGNTYNILGLNNTENEKRFAAEDVIKIYLYLQKRDAPEKHVDELSALRSLLSDALKALEPMAKAGNNIHPDFNSDTAYFELPVLGVQLRTTAALHARIKEVMNSQ